MVIDDGAPVDNLHSEREMRLLVQSLYDSWKPSRPFVAMANVGLFSSPTEPPFVPDVLVSLDASFPNTGSKTDQTYCTWVYQKPPDLVVEIVSNKEGHEERKIEGYARLGIGYYVIHDPKKLLSKRELRVYELHGRRYVEVLNPSWLPQLELGVCLRWGEFQSYEASYLRWTDAQGRVLEIGADRADQEQARAEQEKARAEQERARAERLASRLRELGLEEEQP
ncbi:MAG: Uma2 family endonuclease [Candidatus Eremiobacterota bacterium]